ncbi:MAG TPA: prolyl oligopeptidase family serine peptidase [bacterium]|nr:prolyl oligopeptidase family serine peptidase [bacterium]
MRFLSIPAAVVISLALLVPAAAAQGGSALLIEKPGAVSEAKGKTAKDGNLVAISPSSKIDRIQVYEITYLSTGLKVNGKLFVPPEATPENRLPAVVFNHGGVGGVPGPAVTRCAQLAAGGFVVLAPSYRGEDGSEGEVEVAAGEVDDALNAVVLLRGLSYVLPGKIAMAGTSHGGIITLLAIQRDPSIAAAVCAYGVTNTFTWYQFLLDYGHDVTDPLSRKVYGNGPEDKPDAFRSRAPALDAHLIKTPLLLLYGEDDNIVPPSQATELAKALDSNDIPYELHIFPGVGHGLLFFMDPARRSKEEIDTSSQAWEILKTFIKNNLE